MERESPNPRSQHGTLDELQDELIQEAQQLARRSALYQRRLPRPLAADSTVSPASEEAILDECNEAWRKLGEVQNKLTLCDARTLIQDSENPLAVLLARERALMAELNVQKSREPELLLVNQEVLTSLGKQELQNTDRQLEQILSCVRAKKKSLHEQLDRERKWLEEEREIETSLQHREEDGQMVYQGLLENSSLQRMSKDLQKLTVYKETLLTVLGSFLDTHYPHPDETETPGKRRLTRGNTGLTANFITFHEMLERLMTRTMSSPHDPYLQVDDSFWPPYLEALLRYGVAQRHPDDPRCVRLNDFHL